MPAQHGVRQHMHHSSYLQEYTVLSRNVIVTQELVKCKYILSTYNLEISIGKYYCHLQMTILQIILHGTTEYGTQDSILHRKSGTLCQYNASQISKLTKFLQIVIVLNMWPSLFNSICVKIFRF